MTVVRRAEHLHEPARLRRLDREKVADAVPVLERDQSPGDDVEEEALGREADDHAEKCRASERRRAWQEEGPEGDQDNDCGRVGDGGCEKRDHRLAAAKAHELALFSGTTVIDPGCEQLQHPRDGGREHERKSAPEQAIVGVRRHRL
jgi:hypothetical protein